MSKLEDFTLEEIQDFIASDDYELLDELSKKTLGNYIRKSSNDVKHLSNIQGREDARVPNVSQRDTWSKEKASKRLIGIKQAVHRLTKEEVDSINESKIQVKDATDAVHKTLGTKRAADFLTHLKPGTDTHTSWEHVNSALTKQGVQPKHIATVLSHINSKNKLKKEGIEMENEDLKLEDYSIEELEAFLQTEEYEQLDEISGKVLGSYIQKAREANSKAYAHRKEIEQHPKVKAISDKITAWHNSREYKKDGSSVHQKKIEAARDKKIETHYKVDPNYDKNTKLRHRGIDTAVNKLTRGKLTKEDVAEMIADLRNNKTSDAIDKFEAIMNSKAAEQIDSMEAGVQAKYFNSNENV